LLKFSRAERSSAHRFKGWANASRFLKERFKNSKAEDFLEGDFFGGEVVHKRLTLDPPTRSRVKFFPIYKIVKLPIDFLCFRAIIDLVRNSIFSNKSLIDKLSVILLSLTLIVFFAKIAIAILAKNTI